MRTLSFEKVTSPWAWQMSEGIRNYGGEGRPGCPWRPSAAHP